MRRRSRVGNFPENWEDERTGPLSGVRDVFSPRPSRPGRSSRQATPFPAVMTLEVARLILDEAQSLFAARREQALRAEARATTLQASAGIAIGLALTGGAFLVDPEKVANPWWRLGLALVLALLLCCLGMAGYLASRATATLLRYWAPTPDQTRGRASMSAADAARDRAMGLLECVDRNYYFSNFKIRHVQVAGLWFRAALGCFGLLSILLMVYAVRG